MNTGTADFDRLVFRTLAMDGHHAFLVVLLNAQKTPSGQLAVQVAGSLIENCVRGFDFSLFKRDMKQNNLDWDLAVVRVANVADGSALYLTNCQQELDRVEQNLNSGNIAGLSVFDKKGCLFQGLCPQRRDFSDTVVFSAGAPGAANAAIQSIQFEAPLKDFDALIANMKNQPVHNTALISLVKVEPVVDAKKQPGSMIGVAAQAAYPVDDSLTFAHVIETSKRDDVDWDLICVVMANNRDGTPASDIQCTTYLRDIAQRLSRGDLAGFTFFDNLGRPVEAIPSNPGPASRPPQMR